MAVSFLDLYHDISGEDCGDCPIEGGCNGSFIEGVEILEGQVDCRCEKYWDGEWVSDFCPHIPCSEWPGPGTFEFYHCGPGCVKSNPAQCEANSPEDGIQLCTEDCPCATLYRLICGEDADSCVSGAIRQKCCNRLHVYYGAYHDGEKYWLSDNPMRYFTGADSNGNAPQNINCKRECGAATLSTAPVCQGNGLFWCPNTGEVDGKDMWCSPVGCCEEAESDCGNCPHCADPSDAPFCCNSDPKNTISMNICDFYERIEAGEQITWQEWCVDQYGEECLIDSEPYYWKFCGIGGWGISEGDVHVERMYFLDDEEDSPTYGQKIPCAGQQGCDNTALYDIYDLTGGGGGVEPFVPHVLILYGNHIRVGSFVEAKSSYVVKGWWVSCTSEDNYAELPIEDNTPDCHCPDSPTAEIGACCIGDGFCQDLTAVDCDEQGGKWWGPGGICSDNPCD